MSDGGAEGEAEAEAGEAGELAERAQDDQAGAAEARAERELRGGVGEALVDDEEADFAGEGQRALAGSWRRPSGLLGLTTTAASAPARAAGSAVSSTCQPAARKAAACSL